MEKDWTVVMGWKTRDSGRRRACSGQRIACSGQRIACSGQRRSGAADFALRENGLELDIDVKCPDSAEANNIALVLDNSGSLSGLAFDSLKAGAHAVVDSLRDNDATAIYHFSNGGERVLDFTSDRTALHAAVAGLALGANTPIYQTTDLALRELAVRPGRKYCILFTDGTDNASAIPWEDLIPRAADRRRAAVGRGGDRLALVHDRLRGRGLRRLAALPAIETTLGAETASDDTVFVSPFRADTLRARGMQIERSFAHILDAGGMRRTTLRGRESIEKRYKIAALA